MGYSLDFAAVLGAPHLGWLLDGLILTVELTIASWILAFAVAIILVLLRNSNFKPAEWFVSAYVEVQQNIPLLVHVLFWYFAMPELLPEPARIWLNEHNSEFILAMFGLSFCMAAYISEAIRSGLRAIPRTQYEAGRVLGFGYLRTMRYIVIPQAVRIAIPPLVNYALLLFKNTSIAMAIGVHELTYQTRQIESDTFRTFEIFAVSTVIYLVISFLIMAAGSLYENHQAIPSK
ncbi:amino acid ABC transporter permease [Rhizobium rhizogenes]|uniref:amino acid ABC transporter permease n=1 Tax=Rhizobium rhizogenes TaxID=359 RepID=UPI00157420F7|nr:amino acid ABC transporter permease [Rhizobium rhizogenes]NTH22910.1 amino acid ABC transporter permease [Rhizobium rhizogenes]NTH35939.1 amino acid ABC transporter permease [Rhizobium rhizogenes]